MDAKQIAEGALKISWWNTESQARRVAEYAEELLSASKPAAPLGWKLVPVELTQPMRDAFFADGGIERVDWLTKGYAAMLAASPAAPAQSVTDTPVAK